jgi:hypothetical protein
LFKYKALDRTPDASDDVVAVARPQASRRDAPYASETNNGDGRTVIPG